MPRFAANLSMMYQELPFLDRFEAAAKDGFTAIEYLFPYDFTVSEIRSRLLDNGLTQALFNAPPGEFIAGERGIAALPGREKEFRRSIETALAYAEALGCDTLHVMAGIVNNDKDADRHRSKYIDNLAFATAQARPAGVTIVIEPINTRDMPGYFLNYQADAHAIREELRADNLKVLFDLYHCQIMEGDLIATIRAHGQWFAHYHTGGVPGRHELDDTQEVQWDGVMRAIAASGFKGYVAHEFIPTRDPLTSLRQAVALCDVA